MINRFRYLLPVVISVLLTACSSADKTEQHPLFVPSASDFPTQEFTSFAQYQKEISNWLKQNRVVLNGDAEQELERNAPFELKPQDGTVPEKGVILVHGLGDSPWSFIDLAQEFSSQGYLVRTLLLPGHGSRPADLINADVDDWKNLVRYQVKLMKADVEHVSLGGFSTGANLVTEYAIDDAEIESLYLFSPAFKSDSRVDFLAPLSASMIDWIYQGAPESHTNTARYNTVPMNGFAQYYWTSADVQKRLDKKVFDRPAFLAVTESDSVVDVREVLSLFERRFTHPSSSFIWYGNDPESDDNRVVNFQGRLPGYRISNFSHMSLLFRKDNPYYGEHGSYRMCRNGEEEAAREKCRNGAEVWYSAYGYREPGKIHARLTFNPHFDKMSRYIRLVQAASHEAGLTLTKREQ